MKISIRRFLTIGLLTVFLSGALTVLALWHSTNYSKSAVESLAECVESAASALRIQQNFAIHRKQSLVKSPNLELTRSKLLGASEDLSQFSSSTQEDYIIKKVQKSVTSYLKNYASLKADGYTVKDFQVAGSQEYYETLEAIQELTKFNLDEAKSLKAETTYQNRLNYLFVSFAFVLLSLSFIILFIGLRKLLYNPIIAFKNILESFELGEKTFDANTLSGAIEIQSIASSFKNLSSRLTKQKELQHTFLSAIAHDLKNPLNAIKMSTELMTDNKQISSENRELLNIIGRQTDHLTRLIGDLLDTTRIESGHMEFHFDPYDIRKLVQDSIVLHSSLSKTHQIELSMPPKPILALCDEQRITQVLNNLLNNAIKYSPNGGRITVLVTSDQKYASIKISDFGVGILPEDLEKIFEPYHRSSTTRNSIPGIGLGLYVSRKILRSHEEGNISVQSEIGKGTIFTIRLKLIPPSNAEIQS